MTRLVHTLAVVAALSLLAACSKPADTAAPAAPAAGAPASQAAAGGPSFDAEVKAIFAERCAKCHTEDTKGGLSLTSLESTLAGGKSGAVVTPGNSAGSLLYSMVSGAPDVKRMPPKGDPLSAEQVATIQKWIDGGAK